MKNSAGVRLEREQRVIATLRREGLEYVPTAGRPYCKRLYRDPGGILGQLRLARESILTMKRPKKIYQYGFWNLNFERLAPGVKFVLVGLFDLNNQLQAILRLPVKNCTMHRSIPVHRLAQAEAFAEIVWQRIEKSRRVA